MSANIIHLVSITLSAPKSHMNIIKVLVNLDAGYDYSSSDRLFFLKETMTSPYQKDFQKIKHFEFQFLIENDT